MKVVIRTDASLRIGTGHVMRCMTLAKALTEKGGEVTFICRNHEGNLIDKIQTEDFKVYSLITRPGEKQDFSDQTDEIKTDNLSHSNWLGVTQQQDAQACQPILERIQPDWLIVDHYAIDQAWQKWLKPHYQNLMVIDDLGDRYHHCDLLLDQNHGSSPQKYEGLVPQHCQLLTGAKYALLRPEFAQWRDVSLKHRENNTEINNILVTLGGVDPDNYTGKVLQQLETINFDRQAKITVIMGATALHLETVQQQAAKMNVQTQVKTNVTNMAEIMANADLAIGAAGATTWERCCLGLPTIQLVIADNQRQIAQVLAKDHVVKLLEDAEELPGLVKKAAHWANKFSQQAAKICDGSGSQRVIDQFVNGNW